MSAAIEANIIEKLHQLSEYRQAEVLDFVEYLATKSKVPGSWRTQPTQTAMSVPAYIAAKVMASSPSQAVAMDSAGP